MNISDLGFKLADSAGNIINNGAKRACEPNCGVDLGGIFKIVSNSLFGIAGSIAVIFIIMGGIQYITSQGDPGHITKAKNTILYAVMGLVAVLVSFAIVSFVIARFT